MAPRQDDAAASGTPISLIKINRHVRMPNEYDEEKGKERGSIGFGKEPKAAERRPGSGRSTPIDFSINAPHANPRRY